MSSQPDQNPLAIEAEAMNNSTDSYLREVARIARVPDASQISFVRLLGSAIKRANKVNSPPEGKNISAGVLAREYFDPIVRAAENLRVALERLRGEHDAAGEAARSMAASHFFSETLQLLIDPEVGADPIGHLIDSLKLGMIVEAAERASARAKSWLSKGGRKKGTGRPAFDMFVMALLEASNQTAGRLTIYRTSHEDDRWAGSLPKAVQQLRPLLPTSNFFPAGTLGHSLHTIYQRWRSEVGKSRRKKG
jgi:hypothetical protein